MRTFELEINEHLTNSLLLFLKKYSSTDYNIYEIKKTKVIQPIVNKNIEFVSDAEQKEIEKEITDPDCHIIESSETIEI